MNEHNNGVGPMQWGHSHPGQFDIKAGHPARVLHEPSHGGRRRALLCVEELLALVAGRQEEVLQCSWAIYTRFGMFYGVGETRYCEKTNDINGTKSKVCKGRGRDLPSMNWASVSSRVSRRIGSAGFTTAHGL